MKRMRFSTKGLLIAGIVSLTCTATWAESVWVKAEIVDIRSGKGAVYPSVAKVKKGTELNVIAREDKWFKVTIPPNLPATAKEGYIFENSISMKKVGGGGSLADIGVTGGDMSTAAAAKGLRPAAENYAANKHMSSTPLNNLIALRNRIDPKEYERFMAEGHVGVH
jgi:uncharacterized protein YgiM (DUF1202 family)